MIIIGSIFDHFFLKIIKFLINFSQENKIFVQFLQIIKFENIDDFCQLKN